MSADIQSIVIYWFGLLLTLLIVKIYKNDKKAHTNPLLKVACLVGMAMPLSLIAGFRCDVGTDYSMYCILLNRFTNYSFTDIFQQDKMEVGFVLLIKILSYISSDLKFLFFSIEFLTIIVAFKAAIDFDERIDLIKFVFFYYMIIYHYSLNISRQCLAVSIILLAISYLCNNNIKSFFIATVFAYFIHTTAVFCVLFAFAYFKTNKTQLSALKNILFYTTIIMSPVILYILFLIIPSFSIINKYDDYMYDNSKIGIGTLVVMMMYVLPIIYLLITRRLDAYLKNASKIKSLCNLLLFLIPFFCIGMTANFAIRVIFYSKVVFALFLAMINGNLINIDRKESDIIIIQKYYIAVLIYEYIMNVLIQNQGQTFPYRWE